MSEKKPTEIIQEQKQKLVDEYTARLKKLVAEAEADGILLNVSMLICQQGNVPQVSFIAR